MKVRQKKKSNKKALLLFASFSVDGDFVKIEIEVVLGQIY